MSLPSWAVFFKDDQEEKVNSCFINVGWFFDKERLLQQVKHHIETTDFEYDYFVAYGEKYRLQLKEITDMIIQLRNDRRIETEKLIEISKKLREESKNAIVLPVVGRSIPSVVADSIIHVQSMSADTMQIMKMSKIKERK